MPFRKALPGAPLLLAAIVSAALLLPAAVPAAIGQSLPFPMDVPLDGVTTYDPSIPTPESVIGHVVGTRHTEPHKVVAYFEAVAAASDRVVLREHARSYEGRPLIHALVTAPERHARLDDVRRRNLRLSDAPEAVADADLAGMPVVVYAGYSIHGNEASGSEAAMLLLYHLAAGSGPEVDDVLANAVVLLDPMFNPDGRGRFTTWANRNRGGVPVADPADREHAEPWPSGRTNHYWFDLNRDWLPAQHPESRGRLELFHSWRPQVLTDHHEMESEATFFFQPGIPSRNHPITPEQTFELTRRLGEYHAGALDRIGSLYYTKESFDDFYYGKGSTYPDVNGAVGILFEQASSRALEREVADGTLTYAFTVRNQFVTSLSTLAGAVAMREDLLRHQRDFYARAADFAAAQETSAYVLDVGDHPARAEALFELLRRHRVRVHGLARDVTVDGAAFSAGEALIIPLNQPQARFIQGAMERVTTFQDSLFYDVSAWTLPLAFGVRYAEMRGDAAAYVGEEVTAFSRASGGLIGGSSDYVYVLEWGSYYAPRTLHRLQELGLRTRAIAEPFASPVAGEVRTFPRGSIVVEADHPEMDHAEIARRIRTIADEDRVRIFAVGSGLTANGPDLGTRRSALLESPSIVLVTGQGTSAYNAGEVWHLLSERFRIPVSLVDAEAVGSSNLDRYDTMVLAGGSYDRLDAGAVTAWVHGGGHLITLTDAAGWAVSNGLFEIDEKPLDLDSLYRDLPFEELERARGAQRIGGTILRADVDPTHPVAYGFDESVPVFRRGTTFYAVPDEPGVTVARYADEPLLSGYISPQMLGHAAGSVSIAARGQGRGRVTMFMDNPNLRAFWYGTNGLFLNAVFLGGLY